ncbi:hypothetical protein HGRIS_009820 [Hohenbuehelia grisea]|uniref:18S rRNA factor 2 n=1 Tax=Hohenbuehelia grisea TaxID=104357 RepID=A0ABR3J2V9_9AGAR
MGTRAAKWASAASFFDKEPQSSPGASTSRLEDVSDHSNSARGSVHEREAQDTELPDGVVEGMDLEGFSGPSQSVVKPLTPEALAAFQAAQDRAGVVYISRIPPGMRPAKVRHLMSAYGEIGRVYLQQEDAKRAYLRRKFTSTKKAHFTEGWVEFKDKKIARSVAMMLNAQPIGGKKGTRWRDDVWTMKYLPKFKWNMLTEQIAHEAALHAAKLRVELSQSKSEQQDYLKNVELARILEKRAERKRVNGADDDATARTPSDDRKDLHIGKRAAFSAASGERKNKRTRTGDGLEGNDMSGVLQSIF